LATTAVLLNQHAENIHSLRNQTRSTVTTYSDTLALASVDTIPIPYVDPPTLPSVPFAPSYSTGIQFVLPTSLTFRSQHEPDEATISTNHSIASDSTISADDVIAPVTLPNQPYNNRHYLGSLPFYFPKHVNPTITQLSTVNITLGDVAITDDVIPAQLDEDSSQDSHTLSLGQLSDVAADAEGAPISPEIHSRSYNQSTLESCWDSFQPSCESLKKNEKWAMRS
jgi:hypothetical protein